MANDVNVRIGSKFDAKGVTAARKDLDSLGKSASTASQNIGKSFIETGAKILTAVKAVQGFKGAVDKMLTAHAQQERAELRLVAAARNNPLINGQGVKQLLDYASALQKVSTFGDEAILQQQSFLVSLGLTAEQIENIMLAATNLASTGMTSLESATKNIAKTLGGMTGELGELIPQLKNLSKEELKAGEAVDFLLERYSGMNEMMTKGLQGWRDQVTNIKGDMTEKLGGIMAALWEGAGGKGLKQVLDDMNTWLANHQADIVALFLSIPEIAKQAWGKVKEYGEAIMGKDFWTNLATNMGDWILTVVKNAVQSIMLITSAVGTMIKAAIQVLRFDIAEMLWEKLPGLTKSIVEIKDWMAEQWGALRGRPPLPTLRPGTEEWQANRKAVEDEQWKGLEEAIGKLETVFKNAGESATGFAKAVVVATGVAGLTRAELEAIISGNRPAAARLLAPAAGQLPAAGGGATVAATKETWNFVSRGILDVFGELGANIALGFEDNIIDKIASAFEWVQTGAKGRIYQRGTHERPGGWVKTTDNQLTLRIVADTWLKIQNMADNAWNNIVEFARDPWGKLKDAAGIFLQASGEILKNVGGAVMQGLGQAASWLVNSFISLFTQTQNFQQLIGSLNQTLVSLMEAAVMPLITAITPLIDIAISLVQGVMPYVVGLFNTLGYILAQTQPFWVALGDVILRIVGVLMTGLGPIFAALVPIMNSLAPVFDTIGRIFEALQGPLTVVADVVGTLGVIFGWLISKVVAFGETLWYIISLQWEKAGAVDWGQTLGQAMASYQQSKTDIAAYMPGETPSIDTSAFDFGTSPSLTGGSTTVTKPPDIYIHVHIAEGGVSVMGDRELLQVGDVVVKAVEEVLGSGGRVSWLPAGA